MRRRHFLAAGAFALAGCGGGDSGGGGATTAGGAPAGLPGAPDDGAVLAFMLGLEQLQGDLYQRTGGLFRGGEAALVSSLAEQEASHVETVRGELRRLKQREPRPRTLRAVPGDRNGALALAYRLENLTAAAYLGQVGRLVDSGALATVLALQSVEGRHAAAVGALIGKTATPDGAVAQGQNMATIDRVVGELAA